MMNFLFVIFKEMRPQFLILTPVCYLIGFGSAAYVLGGFNKVPLGHAILALIGALFSHVAVNVLNDYFDYQSGLDLRTRRTSFSGGSGILPQDLMHPKEVLIMGIISLVVVIAIGIYFLEVRGWGIVPIGLIGILIIIFYTPLVTKIPALCLITPGLGFGPLMVMGTHYVLTGQYNLIAFYASLVPGFLVCNLLLINQFPDLEADRSVHRQHLPIVIGRKTSSYVYAILSLSTFGWVIAATVMGLIPEWTLIALLPFPLAIMTILGVLKSADDIDALIPFLGKNVVYTLATPFFLGIGLLISSQIG